jgi:hypothetical protein
MAASMAALLKASTPLFELPFEIRDKICDYI